MTNASAVDWDLKLYFGWRLLTPKVAEAMPQEAVDKFDELQAEKICDVFKIRYGFRDRDVEQLVSEHSAVLGYSLKHQILPAVNILEKDLELGLTDYCDVAIRRLVLRVPQMLANDLSDPQLRADFALHAKRVLHLTDAETKNLMKVYNTRHCDSLNLVEFTALAKDWKLDEATAAKVFKKYDKDKDGELNMEELKVVIEKTKS